MAEMLGVIKNGTRFLIGGGASAEDIGIRYVGGTTDMVQLYYNGQWRDWQSGGMNVPDGKTVTPVNDVIIWQQCAGISNPTYTTISEIIADSGILSMLISNNNASDYMARSTSFASSICADSVAMQDIGANNYCADVLTDSSAWCAEIANSTYIESVLNVKVPAMTSDTAPSGIASASSVMGAQFSAYEAFDRNDNTSWAGGANQTNQWVQYQFTDTVKLCCMDFKANLAPVAYTYPSNFTVKGSDNGTDFNKILGDFSDISYGSLHRLVLTPARLLYVRTTLSNCNYRYVDGSYDVANCVCSTLQFYGRVDVA